MNGGDVLLGVVLGLLAVWAVLVAVLWVVRPRDVPLSELVAFVPDLVRLVRSLIADRSAPVAVRAALVVLLVWLISPIDLIPEFIPVLGPLDDIVVAVVVLRFVRRRLGIDSLRTRWTGSEAGFRLLERMVGAE
jgi:uncharacterized membrane protein YkvA (DUF1232 family)